MAGDHGRMLAQDGRDLLSRQSEPIERAKVGQLARRPNQTMAEIVLAAGVELHVRWQRATRWRADSKLSHERVSRPYG